MSSHVSNISKILSLFISPKELANPDEIVSTNEKRLLDEVNDVNTKFNEDMKKTNLIKKALKASLNCLIGKK